MSKELKSRSEIEVGYKWDLEKIYLNIESFEKDFAILKEQSEEIKKFKGTLNSAENILAYLELNEKLSRKLENLYVYANMKSHEDTRNTDYQGLVSKMDSFMAVFGSYNSFFEPEILGLEDGKIEGFLKENENLKEYKFLFENILKSKEHILSNEMEELLAAASDSLGAAESIYEILTNADMKFTKIKDEDGKEVQLTEGNYGTFIRSKNREVRKMAFEGLFNEYKKYENTLATSLSASIKSFIFKSKARKYSSALEASLSPNDIPVEVYHNAIKTINNNLPTLHRYVDLKKKLLGVEEIHMYDLYTPLIDSPKEDVEYEAGVEIVKSALTVLGDEYLNIFNEGINNRWIDVYENEGKRSGAYSWGAYDTMPYVLLNYNNTLNDVSTLAHEMGHSIHSYYSRKNQPYVYGNYTLFSAEIASTTNEIILINKLINEETDKNKKLYLINQEIEQIRTTVFRQLMFAEFELITHEKIEDGEALTAKEFNDIWIGLNKKYFGENIIIDKEIAIEWARIPHFYSDFYVYQYATGYAAATAFSRAILNDGVEAVEKYKGFLKAGGSKYPIDAIKDGGVDMTTSKPLEVTLQRFNELIDMFEEII
ncbi:MAG: oligoendopeptidase F [Sarcina sp.]